jgi:hypothetical protein
MKASPVPSRSSLPALAAVAALAITLAYAFVSGCGSCSNCAVPTFVAHPTPPITNLRVALVSDDGHSATHGITMLKLEDNNGDPLPVPTATLLPIPAAGDLDGEDLTPNGARGVAIDGGNNVYFFTGADIGTLTLSPNTLNVAAFGGDGDSISTLPDGDEVVVSADGPTQEVVISGIISGNPVLADTVNIPGRRDATIIPADGKTLLARGPSGLTVYSIKSVHQHLGSLGGLVRHDYTQVADFPTEGDSSRTADGRGGMAVSRQDFTRALLIGTPSDFNVVSMITGLPNSPTIHPATLHPTGSNTLFSSAISKDGTTAFIGADTGIVVVSGVDTGNLVQVGAVFSPTFMVGSNSFTLGNVRTLGVTLDGRFLAAFCTKPNQNSGTMLLIRIGTGGSLSVVGQFNNIAVPVNDQVLMH